MTKQHSSRINSWSTIGAMAIGLSLMANQPAHAELQIQEPEVEAGSVEFQFTNGWALSTPKGDDLEYTRRSHEAEIQIGINKFLMLELGGEFEEEVEIEDGGREPSSLNFTEIELGVQLELLDVSKHWLGLALVAGFTSAQTDEENDSVNWGAILKLAHGPLSLTTNTYFSDPHTDDAKEDHINFEYGAQILYRWNENLSLGAEAIGEIDNVYNAGSTSTQPHRLGPVIYLSLQRGEHEGESLKDDDGTVNDDEDDDEGVEVTLGLGALFGLTDVTPDTTIKADLAIEF